MRVRGESSVTNVLTIAPVGLNLTAKSVRLHDLMKDFGITGEKKAFTDLMFSSKSSM